jgi:hypothetical protein
MEKLSDQSMLEEYIISLADQMGMYLSHIRVVDGKTVGCLDAYLLNISAKGKTVGALAYQSEMDCINKGLQSDRLELKIRMALSKLKMLLES